MGIKYYLQFLSVKVNFFHRFKVWSIHQTTQINHDCVDAACIVAWTNRVRFNSTRLAKQMADCLLVEQKLGWPAVLDNVKVGFLDESKSPSKHSATRAVTTKCLFGRFIKGHFVLVFAAVLR